MEKAEVISKDLLKTGNQTDEQKRKFRMTGILLINSNIQKKYWTAQ